MMANLTEANIEQTAIAWLEAVGYAYLSGEVLAAERPNRQDVVLVGRLRAAIDRLNVELPADAREQALRAVLNLAGGDLMANNEAFHRLLTDGVRVSYRVGDETVHSVAWLMDFDNVERNDFVVCNQLTVTERDATRRADVVIFVNGLPLVVMELKNPLDEQATLERAIWQLRNYADALPSLLQYNGVLVVSDGVDAKMGALNVAEPRFMDWKMADGEPAANRTVPRLETLIKGMLRPAVLLELVRHFTVFEKQGAMMSKKIAAEHQYNGVKKAVASAKAASGTRGNRKAGVFWHAQGSGKSLSMVFFVGKIVLELDNPTVVVITDRNDLDEQLFDTFAKHKALLRQEPRKAESSAQLKSLLKTAGGGIIFTTIQKFAPDEMSGEFDLLSERSNIVVLADEAHRSQYGFGAKTRVKQGAVHTKYGFAKYLRDALPNATFLGFTGTPIEKGDTSTRAVFGDDIDVYDFEQSVKDGATVTIYYESRLVKVHLDAKARRELDDEVEQITETEEATATQKMKNKLASVEAVIGSKARLRMVALDIVEHFEKRERDFQGKGMIVVMSRRIAVALYDELVALRPNWHADDKRKGTLKVVMTSNSSDPPSWQKHHTNKAVRQALAVRFKDEADDLKLVIVRDMWLTGFDVPCLHTMYLDRVLRGHSLMQAIARVNRRHKDKKGGLIVDYIGIGSDLRQAVATYTASGGRGEPVLAHAKAVDAMLEKYDVVVAMFAGFDYKRYFDADTQAKLGVLLEAHEHILGLPEGKNRFAKEVGLLGKAFALANPAPQALEIRDEVGFFQAVKARLAKFNPRSNGRSDAEVETAIRQIVDKAVVADGVIDIFGAAGVKRPRIDILSDEFLDEVRGMRQKNLALELLRKILADEIRTIAKTNLILGKNLSEMLDGVIRKYQNKLITMAQLMDELVELAKKTNTARRRGEDLNLSDDEIAFYDALENKSAKEVLGDETLRELAQVLVETVRANATIDWTLKEKARAKLRITVRRILARYGYPPDKQKLAVDNVLRQAEHSAKDWSPKRS